MAHSRELSLAFALPAPHEASLIQPTNEPAEAIDAARIVTLRIFADKRILPFYGFHAVTVALSWRPTARRTAKEITPMADTNTKNEAAETRPVPSQAEGDEETVDRALEQQEEKDRK